IAVSRHVARHSFPGVRTHDTIVGETMISLENSDSFSGRCTKHTIDSTGAADHAASRAISHEDTLDCGCVTCNVVVSACHSEVSEITCPSRARSSNGQCQHGYRHDQDQNNSENSLAGLHTNTSKIKFSVAVFSPYHGQRR